MQTSKKRRKTSKKWMFVKNKRQCSTVYLKNSMELHQESCTKEPSQPSILFSVTVNNYYDHREEAQCIAWASPCSRMLSFKVLTRETRVHRHSCSTRHVERRERPREICPCELLCSSASDESEGRGSEGQTAKERQGITQRTLTCTHTHTSWEQGKAK